LATAASQSCGDKDVANPGGEYKLPLPARLGLADEFYRYCKLHELRFQRCTGCGAWRHLPRPMCGECGSFSYEWARSSGKGKVYSWITVVQPMVPAFTDAVPYVVPLVDMEEGVRMVAMIKGVAPEAMEIGMPVEVVFEDATSDITLPRFRKAN
jgi:hypothetical protein